MDFCQVCHMSQVYYWLRNIGHSLRVRVVPPHSVRSFMAGCWRNLRRFASLTLCCSQCYPVTNAVPQDSVLRQLLVLVHVNDLSSFFQSLCLIYRGDVKLQHIIQSPMDYIIFQDYPKNLSRWPETWKMPINFSSACTCRTGWEGKPRFTVSVKIDLQSVNTESNFVVVISTSFQTVKGCAATRACCELSISPSFVCQVVCISFFRGLNMASLLYSDTQLP